MSAAAPVPFTASLAELSALVRERCTGGIAVLCGGWSPERDVSLQSGKAVADALERARIDATLVDMQEGQVHTQLDGSFDTAFIALHGPFGEDGVVQGCLQGCGIRYTGSGVLASALAMDKQRSKQLWQATAVPTADFEMLDTACHWQTVIDKLGGAAFVKPCHEGSSIGMSIARSAQELEAAYVEAAQYDAVVLAEQLVDGREFHVSVLNGIALPPVEVRTEREFYDYQAKYLENTTEYFCPCDLPASEIAQLESLAAEVFDSLGCHGWARIDFMRDQDGNFYVLELNPIPGLTSHSLFPMAAKAAGIDFDAMVLHILLTATDKTA